MAFKVVIGDPSTGKCEQKESDDAATKALTGLKIGDTVKGELFGLPGRTLVVTGGSDDCGFPMRRDISGTLRKRILITGGVGFHASEKGQRRRKTVAGNTIREAVRSRILYTLLAFAVLMIGAGVFLANLSYVEQERILQGLAFSAMRLFGAVMTELPTAAGQMLIALDFYLGRAKEIAVTHHVGRAHAAPSPPRLPPPARALARPGGARQAHRPQRRPHLRKRGGGA